MVSIYYHKSPKKEIANQPAGKNRASKRGSGHGTANGIPMKKIPQVLIWDANKNCEHQGQDSINKATKTCKMDF